MIEIPSSVYFPETPPVESGACQSCGRDSLLTECEGWQCQKLACERCYKDYGDCGLCLKCAAVADKEIREIRWPLFVCRIRYWLYTQRNQFLEKLCHALRRWADRICLLQEGSCELTLRIEGYYNYQANGYEYRVSDHYWCQRYKTSKTLDGIKADVNQWVDERLRPYQNHEGEES
jgi:hypothetical protein